MVSDLIGIFRIGFFVGLFTKRKLQIRQIVLGEVQQLRQVSKRSKDVCNPTHTSAFEERNRNLPDISRQLPNHNTIR